MVKLPLMPEEDQISIPANYNKLTPTQRRMAREKYEHQQGGKCAHCGSDLSGEPAPKIAAMKVNPNLFPPTFFRFPVHLHHDHKTGLTIGAVHNHCNAVLWQYHGE